MNVLFEHLGVQAVYMQDQAVLSMYSYHETTGVMVDIGDRMDIVPVVQGVQVQVHDSDVSNRMLPTTQTWHPASSCWVCGIPKKPVCPSPFTLATLF